MNIDTSRTWEQVLYCLQNTHTLSSRDICHILKSTRAWVNEYVIPFLDTIYLSGYIPKDSGIKRINWLQIASIQMNDRPLHDSMWINETSFLHYIENCISSITRQTRRIPIELLVQDTAAYLHTYQMHLDKIDEYKNEIRNGNLTVLKKLQRKQNELKSCFMPYLGEAEKKLYQTGIVNLVRRGEVFPVPTKLPSIEKVVTHWQAPHDKKGYGDTDESIYRQFFKEGYIKIELTFENLEHQISKKVFYLPDPEPLKAQQISEYITISELAYQKYLSEKNTPSEQ